MKKGYTYLLHFFYWFLFFVWGEVAASLFDQAHRFDWGRFVSPLQIGECLVFMTPFYLNYAWVMPRYFRRNKMRRSWLAWVALLVFFIGFRYLVEYLLTVWFDSPNYGPATSFRFFAFDNVYFGANTILASIFIWCAVNWKELEKDRNCIAMERNAAELSLLKSQVNPHFLFNTLNNIYSLVHHRSELAQPAIGKLSELMRYMIKEAAMDHIELHKEIAYIESYIELESLRIPDQSSVVFSVEGDVSAKNIAPLILIPFIENGFKHGVLNTSRWPFTISLTVTGNDLLLKTSNKINRGPKDGSSGIGLSNVRRRLEILYTGRYSLEAGEQGDLYICNLTIKL